MKKIMILGASILQLPAIVKAKSMGLLPIVVDMNPDAVGFKEDGIIREVISTIDREGILESAIRNNIDGIMTLATDMPMQSVAYVANKLNLVGITEDTALKATNKAFMRDALKSAGVPIPEYYKVNSKKEFIDAVHKITEHGYRCIVKPMDNSGSKGIDLLKDLSAETLETAYSYSKENSRSGGLMVEEYMEGPEVSVETIAVDGIVHVIQITDKLTTGAPYFVEMGHNEPSLLNIDTQEKIKKVAIAANHAIGITSGPSHTEIKVTNDGPKIVELGARLGGDNITTQLVPLSTGVDLVECCIHIAMGEKPSIEPKWSRGSAIRYFNTNTGVIKDILGIDEAKKIPGIKDVEIVKNIGSTVGKIRSSGDRAGFVISCASNSVSAGEAADAALGKVHFVIQ
jgi:biotin carboxylase